MDGVPMLTQDIQEPYTTMSYEFVPPDAGTYWYHSHYNSQEQVARGLIGPLIVEEASQIDVDEDITIILSDWLMNNDGQLIEEFSDMHSVAHAGFMGNYARAIFSKTKIHMGDRVRLHRQEAPLRIHCHFGQRAMVSSVSIGQKCFGPVSCPFDGAT